MSKSTDLTSPHDSHRTIIIVPCYNEAQRLNASQFLEFSRHNQLIDFLFVNDGSQDETIVILQELSNLSNGNIRHLDLKINQGKAEAVRQGMLFALKEGYDYAGYFDADLATPLEEIPRFICLIESKPELWMVLGARVLMLGRTIKRKAIRHYLGRIFATVVSLLLNLPVYDTQCGAKLFRNNPAVRKVFERPFVSRWIFDVEIIKHLLFIERSSGNAEVEKRFYELPLNQWEDVAGSKLKSTDFFKAFVELIKIQRIHF
ncbi:MAG: hypothetical protein RJA81_1092 [Planctomycetota bacterium]